MKKQNRTVHRFDYRVSVVLPAGETPRDGQKALAAFLRDGFHGPKVTILRPKNWLWWWRRF
jgi:hypothetical protein